MAVNMNTAPPIIGGSVTLYKNSPFSYTFTPTVPYTSLEATGTAASYFSGNVFSSTTGISTIGTYSLLVRALQPNATVTTTVASNALINQPFGITTSNNDVYMASSFSDRVVKIDSNGTVTNFAGGSSPGYIEGTGSAARLSRPWDVVWDPSASCFYFTDGNNFKVRKITPGGTTSFVAGSTSGFADGTGAAAKFIQPMGITVDGAGMIYITDSLGYRIRKITPAGVVTTVAGTGAAGFADGPGATAKFNLPRNITADPSTNTLYVTDRINHCIRKITNPGYVVSTIAGNPTVAGYADGVGTSALFNQPAGIWFDTTSNCLYVCDVNNQRIRKVLLDGTVTTLAGSGTSASVDGLNLSASFASPNDVALDASRNMHICQFASGTSPLRKITLATAAVDTGAPSGYTYVATSGNVTVGVLSRLNILYENPPVINGLAQLYKYEPFLYQYSTALLTDTIQVTPTPEVLPYLTTTANTANYGSSNGYGLSYTTPLLFSVQVISNSNIVESRSFNVNVGNGRFFPPASNSSYVFYRYEPVATTYGGPIEFDTSATMTNVFTTPSLPVGLTITQGDLCGNVFLLGGTPNVQVPANNYQFIGKNTTNGRIVTTTVSITVSGERIRLNLSGSSNVSPMTVGTPIAERAVTAGYPGTYSPPQFQYEWSNNPPNGIVFANVGGTQVFSPFSPVDASSTLLLYGTPTLAAANTLAAAGISNYTVNLRARLTGGPSNVIPFTFAFGETVLFTNGSGVPTIPTVRTLYQGETISSGSPSPVKFFAKTFFSSNVGISNIFSPNLRSDLSLNYNVSGAYLYTPTTVLSVSSGVFTLRAINSNGTTRDVSLAIVSLPDAVTFDSNTPSNGTSYSFVVSRPLANSLSGSYPYPIQFTASAKANSNMVYTVTGLGTTGITATSNAGGILLGGTPNAPVASTPLTVTATNTVTGATAVRAVSYSISADVFTFSFSPAAPTTFLQNQPMDPVVVSATTLSGRNVISYSGLGLPSGITITPFGTIQGTPTTAAAGIYTLRASTGYQTGTYVSPYTVVSDAILFIVPQTKYYVNPGSPVPPIQYDAITYSGLNVSNYTIDLSATGALTTFGVTLSTNGTFGGTMSTGIPPDPIFPPETSPVSYLTNAEAQNISGSSIFLIGAENPLVKRSFALLGNNPGCNAIYYSDLAISNVTTQPAYADYGKWLPVSVGTSSNTWFTDIAIRDRGPSGDGLTSNVTIVAMANDISTGYVLRSTDGRAFSTTTLPAGMIMTSVLYSSNTGNWYGAGIQSNDPLKVYMFWSTDDGITWPTSNASLVTDGFSQLETRLGTDTAFETYGTRIIEEYVPYVSGWVISVMGGRRYGGGYSTRGYTLNYGSGWNLFFAMNAETNGSFYDGPYLVVYGTDYYRMGEPNLSFIGSVPTMRAWFLPNGNGEPIGLQFNVACYDVKRFPNFYLMRGIHYYPGLGFREEVRYSTGDWHGPWLVVDHFTPATPYSATRPIEPLQVGPILSDGTNILIRIQAFGNSAIYTHPLSDPDPTVWSPGGTGMDFTGAPAAPDVTAITAIVPISTGTTRPYIEFVTGSNATYLPFPAPVFISPTQTEYNFYQYVKISNIQVTAVPGGVGPGTGGPIYLFLRDQDLPAGLKFDPLTGILSGTPFQTFSRRRIPIYAYDAAARTQTGGLILGPYSKFELVMSSEVPRVVRQQTSAGAYTSLLRQYTEVNGAQNARDNRVYPNQERALGEFMAPPAPDVVTQTVDPRCFDPNACT